MTLLFSAGDLHLIPGDVHIPIPLIAGGAALAVGAAVVGHAVFVPQSSLFCPTFSRADPAAGPQVALTFDDGPWPGSTDRILDALRGAGALATFFVIGRYAARHPDLVRRIDGEGHQIGNHTFDHHRAGLFRGTRYWREQIARADDAVTQIIGRPPTVFRAPMGFKSPLLGRAVGRLGHTVVAWSRRGCDGVAATPERVVHALRGMRAGEILMLHDGRDPASRRDVSTTVLALPGILDRIRELGLTSVRVDQMLAAR